MCRNRRTFAVEMGHIDGGAFRSKCRLSNEELLLQAITAPKKKSRNEQ